MKLEDAIEIADRHAPRGNVGFVCGLALSGDPEIDTPELRHEIDKQEIQTYRALGVLRDEALRAKRLLDRIFALASEGSQ